MITKKNFRNYLMFFFLILFTCLQNLSIIEISGIELKVVHIYAVLCGIFFIRQRKLSLNFHLMVFIFYIIIVSMLNISSFGINGLLVNYLFGLYIVILISTVGRNLSFENWISIFSKVAMIVMIMIWIKNVLQIDKIIYFLNNSWMGHPYISTIFGGGVNLEATWLGMLAFFMYKSNWKWIYFILSLAISLLYASRAGLIVNIIFILWQLMPILKKKNKLYFIFLMMLSIIAVIVALEMGVGDIILERFLNIGEDPGSLGRLAMWKYAGKTILQYPFGVGVGNCMKAIMKVSLRSFWEDNLHNLYLQNFIDLGWLGGIWYILIIIFFVIKELKNLAYNPFVAFLMTYILLSVLQFRGGDTIVFIVLGIYLTLNKKKEKNISGE